MREKIRYAVIGLGHIAQTAVLPAFQHTENSELVALGTGDPNKAKELRSVMAYTLTGMTTWKLRSIAKRSTPFTSCTMLTKKPSQLCAKSKCSVHPAVASRTRVHSAFIFSNSILNFSLANRCWTNCRAKIRPASESLGKCTPMISRE